MPGVYRYFVHPKNQNASAIRLDTLTGDCCRVHRRSHTRVVLQYSMYNKLLIERQIAEGLLEEVWHHDPKLNVPEGL